jgi:hypothetical protein
MAQNINIWSLYFFNPHILVSQIIMIVLNPIILPHKPVDDQSQLIIIPNDHDHVKFIVDQLLKSP